MTTTITAYRTPTYKQLCEDDQGQIAEAAQDLNLVANHDVEPTASQAILLNELRSEHGICEVDEALAILANCDELAEAQADARREYPYADEKEYRSRLVKAVRAIALRLDQHLFEA